MPRAAGSSVENNFKNGLITEASGLNFPENACTETYNCVFNFDGSVQRRLGLDFESQYVVKTIDRDDSAVTTFLWKNVAGDGSTTLCVVQVGGTLYFYETASSSISSGAIASTITLSTYLASGAPTPELLECQFSYGNGLLFVTHPYCDPFYVSYTPSTQTVTGTLITIKIRDFEGATADSLRVDERPTSTLAGLSDSHEYNLYNQGWTSANLTTWDTAQTTMPSNSDVMWTFKDATNNFDAGSGAIARVVRGNSPAPKGHFILALANQDRNTAAGMSGVTATTTSYFRPSTSAFYAGRMFYSGIQYSGFNASIYFSQIVERSEQYAFCYQQNDPTSEDNSDLLPSDGGVIRIPEAGTVYKLVAISGALVVFCANGVWSITGSTGLGFSAVDFTVSKISSINAISASSFVDVGGFPSWWNAEGIYLLSPGQAGVQISSLSDSRIKTFFDAIPLASKLSAKGYFNLVAGVVQWLYRTTTESGATDRYEYNQILNFSTMTSAFYPWTISASNVKVNGIVVLESSASALTVSNVTDDSSNLVIDDSANQVVAYSTSDTASVPSFVYLTSYPNGSTYDFTFAGARNLDYLDWREYGDDTDYISYFISGYKIHGDGIRKFQPNWVSIFSRNSADTSYSFQGLWDYAIASSTGRWSSAQTVSHSSADYSNFIRRLKVRGHGKVLQFLVTSVSGVPFDLLGWSVFETGNTLP
jgi:hypothetical protein